MKIRRDLAYIFTTVLEKYMWKSLIFQNENELKNDIKNVFTLRNDISSKITNFQKDLFFKEHSWRRSFSILFSILSTKVSVIKYFHIWNKIWKSVWQHIRKNIFWIAILYFWTRQPNSFHNLIFNHPGQLLADSVKDFFLKVHRYIIIYYCGLLTKFSLILEDLFRSSSAMP